MKLPDSPAPLTRPEQLRLERFLRSNESGEGALTLSCVQRELQEVHYRELCALLPPMAEAVYRHWHGGADT